MNELPNIDYTVKEDTIVFAVLGMLYLLFYCSSFSVLMAFTLVFVSQLLHNREGQNPHSVWKSILSHSESQSLSLLQMAQY